MGQSEHIRVDRGMHVLDGAYGVIYNVNTIDKIDANLEDKRFYPGHPDIDRLLDARLCAVARKSL